MVILVGPQFMFVFVFFLLGFLGQLLVQRGIKEVFVQGPADQFLDIHTQ
jgi:hypothetical protein